MASDICDGFLLPLASCSSGLHSGSYSVPHKQNRFRNLCAQCSIDGPAAADSVDGPAAADSVDGPAAADSVDGPAAADSVHGPAAADSVDGPAAAGKRTLQFFTNYIARRY